MLATLGKALHHVHHTTLLHFMIINLFEFAAVHVTIDLCLFCALNIRQLANNGMTKEKKNYERNQHNAV